MRKEDQELFFQRLLEADSYIVVVIKKNNAYINIGPSQDLEKSTPLSREIINGTLNWINDLITIHRVLKDIKDLKPKFKGELK